MDFEQNHLDEVSVYLLPEEDLSPRHQEEPVNWKRLIIAILVSLAILVGFAFYARGAHAYDEDCLSRAGAFLIAHAQGKKLVAEATTNDLRRVVALVSKGARGVTRWKMLFSEQDDDSVVCTTMSGTNWGEWQQPKTTIGEQPTIKHFGANNSAGGVTRLQLSIFDWDEWAVSFVDKNGALGDELIRGIEWTTFYYFN